jgi:hypothetical protein
MRRNPAHTSNSESDLLKTVRGSGGLSRIELARILGMVPSTTGIYVERLIKEGFLIESDQPERTRWNFFGAWRFAICRVRSAQQRQSYRCAQSAAMGQVQIAGVHR